MSRALSCEEGVGIGVARLNVPFSPSAMLDHIPHESASFHPGRPGLDEDCSSHLIIPNYNGGGGEDIIAACGEEFQVSRRPEGA